MDAKKCYVARKSKKLFICPKKSEPKSPRKPRNADSNFESDSLDEAAETSRKLAQTNKQTYTQEYKAKTTFSNPAFTDFIKAPVPDVNSKDTADSSTELRKEPLISLRIQESHSQPELICRPTTEKEQPVVSKRYTAKDFKSLDLKIKLGGLGPNVGPKEQEIQRKRQEIRQLEKQWNNKNKKKLIESSSQLSNRFSRGSDSCDIQRRPAFDQYSTRPPQEPIISSARSLDKISISPTVLPVVRVKGWLQIPDPQKLLKEQSKVTLLKKNLAAVRKTRELERMAKNQLSVLQDVLTWNAAESNSINT